MPDHLILISYTTNYFQYIVSNHLEVNDFRIFEKKMHIPVHMTQRIFANLTISHVFVCIAI